MIKIKKVLSEIPNSLRVPDDEYFEGKDYRPSITTHRRRMEVIEKGEYIYHINHDSRYKQEDTKNALKSIYYGKCAFCEQKVEQLQVEHYRPKKIYYCLAFSWDNLLLACATCNQHKKDNFELGGEVCDLDVSNAENINTISEQFDNIELPKMVNPEVTNPLGKIRFYKNGSIGSDDSRFSYTIDTCKISRAELNDERRKILEIFKSDIRSIAVEYSNGQDQMTSLSTIVKKFKRDSEDNDLPFLGFKRYAIENGWLKSLIKDVLS